MSEEIIRIGSRSYSKTFDEYWNRIMKLEQEKKQLKVKSDVLEENNKLLIQQKAQMYEDLDIAYEKIDKALEYIKENFDETGICVSGSDLPYSYIEDLLEILGDKENE